MYAATATCHICSGAGYTDDDETCWHCNGEGEDDCRECLDTASENAFSDMCESEPPLSADERHRMAWQQKQELRR